MVPVTKKNIRRYVTNRLNKFALLNVRKEKEVRSCIKLKTRNRKEGSIWKMNCLIYFEQNLNKLVFHSFRQSSDNVSAIGIKILWQLKKNFLPFFRNFFKRFWSNSTRNKMSAGSARGSFWTPPFRKSETISLSFRQVKYS